MMIRNNFPGADLDSFIAGFDRSLARIPAYERDDATGRAHAISDALVAVLGVKLIALNAERTGASPESPQLLELLAKVEQFFAHARDALAALRPALAAFLGTVDVAVWRRNRTGWYEACMGRSALQVLVEDLHAGLERPLAPPHHLEELDQELREIGPGIGALPAEVIPEGLPAEHWWWSLPAGEVPSGELDED